MAPIQNKSSSSSSSSHSVHKSNLNDDSSSSSKPRHGHRDFDSTWESFLPVTRRGRFFQDSIFENTRSNFDDAVRDALSRWGDDSDFLTDSWHDTTSPRLSNLRRYKQMRSRQVDDDNLAATVTSNNNIHKIVLDVHDFVEGDLKVKVVGDRDLLVEGRREKKTQDGASALSSQKFSRTFVLPEDSDIAAIDSVMSSDGILTITAPKVGRIKSGSTQRESSTFSNSSSKTLQDERDPCDCDKCNPKLNTRECPYKSNVERSQSSTAAAAANDMKSKLHEDSRDRSEQRESRSDSGRRLNSYAQEEKRNVNNEMGRFAERSESRFADKMDIPVRAFFNSRPITRRGRYLDDSFFEDTRGGYKTAIEDILSKWGERSSNTDDMTSYRNLRTRDLRDDNQAVKTIEDEFQHKFVVDVQDFMKDGEINVKAVDDRELVVEGLVEKIEGGSKSIKRFSKSFTLPSDVHLESVSSVMSSDGVLTIIAPKKNALTHTKGCSSYANADEIEDNSELTTKMSGCNIQSCENQAYEKSCCKKDTPCCKFADDDDRTLRASSTCSSAYDVSSAQEEGASDATLHDTVTSKVFKSETSEESNLGGGHISIHVNTADEEDAQQEEENREMRERRHDDINNEIREAKQMLMEELSSGQRGARGRSTDDLDSSNRGIRDRSMESRDSRSESMRVERDFDMMDEEDDDVNFQESSRHSEKKLHSILKTPEKCLQEEDESKLRGRSSRERSYAGEGSLEGDRRTPCKDNRRGGSSLAPLNPNDKRVLPINVRGHFSSDSFFDDFQESFKTAISDVLIKFNEKSNQTDDITAYRNLRLRDPKLENQAFHVQEDQGAHKVVLDVKDFINGDIVAAVYDEKELVVEGRAERRTGTSITTLCFLRRFPLPENVDTDAITVVMSSDGVLTVVTPWKGLSGLSAIKNILSTEDMSMFDRNRDSDRRWDEADFEDSQGSDEFFNRSLDSRLRSRLRHSTDDLF